MANGRLFCTAKALGRPIWTNWCRLEVKLSKPSNDGDSTGQPRSSLLPASQASTSEMNFALSLRIVNSMSLDSSATGTLKGILTMPGLAGLTSVGPATASSSTYLPVSDSSRGMCSATGPPVSPPVSRLK